ncbi:EthD domain-containing protein [Gordonia sp. 'Campus']|uniref:EthD domain-containing protein n=1 Tax=Gordonia sp. 'Campus' TaxID=2915824 RepID=UPI001EE3E6FB|nr:EthD domain-containing protein [Gordonia sp. 'Campus']
MTYTKVIAAIRGGGLARADADDLVARCAAAGAVRVQVNISDDQVSAAMRIDELDPPIVAVVSFWALEAAPVLDAIGEETQGPLAAWEVTARTPLDPDLPADGSRINALSNVAFLRRPADLDHDEWLRRWLDDHTQVAIDTQDTFGYVQNIVERPLTEDAPAVAAIVEELFPMGAVSDIHAFYGSGGDQQELERRMTLMLESVARFGADRNLDVVPTSRYDFDLSRSPA